MCKQQVRRCDGRVDARRGVLAWRWCSIARLRARGSQPTADDVVWSSAQLHSMYMAVAVLWLWLWLC